MHRNSHSALRGKRLDAPASDDETAASGRSKGSPRKKMKPATAAAAKAAAAGTGTGAGKTQLAAAAGAGSSRSRGNKGSNSSSGGSRYTFNVAAVMDPEHTDKSLKDIIALPPSALKGLKAGIADDMFKAFHITTIEDLSRWKYYHIARSIALLAEVEVEGGRGAAAASNLNGALVKEWEGASLRELLEAPPHALQGLAEWSDTTLRAFAITSIADLAHFKWAGRAEALVTLAAYEHTDGHS